MSLLKLNTRGATGPSRSRWCLGIGVLCLMGAFDADGRGALSREYEIKAAFLFNFARFIEWPPNSFADAQSPIVIGVIGDDPFGPALANAVKGRRVNGRAIEARPVHNHEEARTAHLLFVGLGRDEELAGLMRALSGHPVATVGESAGFAARGGTIAFVLREDKVRFEINAAAAAQARVRISAQLEKLATIVHNAGLAKEGACCATSRSGEN